MSNTVEFKRSADELGLACTVLSPDLASKFISDVTQKFEVEKLSGHVAINHDSISVALEPHEFTFSQQLPSGPAFVFFDQLGSDCGNVVVLQDGKSLGKVLENSFGMEYFVSNENYEYLLAVNWYVIEGVGTASDWLNVLAK